jgi:hypothetical protein
VFAYSRTFPPAQHTTASPLHAQDHMSRYAEALYSSGPLPESSTPAFNAGELVLVIKQHPSGWLEVKTVRGEYGYMSPAWVKDVVCAV